MQEELQHLVAACVEEGDLQILLGVMEMEQRTQVLDHEELTAEEAEFLPIEDAEEYLHKLAAV